MARFVPVLKVVPYWGSPQERKILRQFGDTKDLHTKEASFHVVITSYQLRYSTMSESDMTAQEWNKEGDKEFNNGNWSKAISHYTEAIELATDDTEKGLYYDNRAAMYFEQDDYDKVIKDCNNKEKRQNAMITLLILARWRTAYEIFIKEVGENDKVICSSIRIVAGLCKNNVSRTKSTMIKVVLPWCLKMMNSTFTKRVDASEYCLQLEYWAKQLVELRGLQKLMEVASEMMKFKNKISIDITSSTQTLISMYITEIYEKMICSDDDKKTFINAIDDFIGDKLPFDTESKVRMVLAITTLIFSPLDAVGVESIVADVLPWCLEMMNSKCKERVNASQYCLQTILKTYSGINDEPDSIPDEALCVMHKKEIDSILSYLLDKIENNTTTYIARDALIKFITRNIHYTALDWAKRLLKFGGLETLMEIASLLDITYSTQTITSVCLAKIDDLDENDKENFFNIINTSIRGYLSLNDVGCHMRATVAITTLTLGPFNVANAIIIEDGFDDKIFYFLKDKGNDLLIQKVICEFIYAVVTKYDVFNTFIRRSFTILRDLCHLASNDSEDPDDFEDLDNSENQKDSIRIRAFVGICKMTKFEVLKSELQAVLTFDKDHISTWRKVCRQFLTNSQRDIRKWAVEGLSYLTLDLGVKNELMKDQRAVKAIIKFAKIEHQSILYQVNILLVNLCIAYDNYNFPSEREMFVKCFNIDHIQAEDDYVQERRRVLAEAGVTSALVSLAKTGSENSKELIARVFNAICSQHDLRKIVIQEGGTEALLSLALNGTDTGMIYATRALAYLALTTSPEVAFPGQIIMEVVQPISNLLNPERSINERCDALTALCNLASVNNSMREHIFKTEYERIKQLILSHKVVIQFVKQRSDHLFDFMNWSVKDDTDDHTKKAIAGTLATLTAASEEACEKLLGWDIWSTFLPILLNDPDDNLQHKGTEIALNMMNSTKDVAAKLIETDTIMKRVRELSDNNTMQNKEIKELASRVLEAAAKWGKLKRDIEESGLSQSTDNIEHSIKRIKQSDSIRTESDMIAQEWKEKGNEEYKKGNWAKALNHYTNALRLAEDNAEEAAVYYKNRAAVYLMLHDYDKAVKDCDMALMIHRIHNVLDLAFNMSAEKEKRETAMNNYNLLVLAREKVGAEQIFEEENLFKITHVVKLQKNEKMICSAIRIVGELCKNNINQTESIMKYVGLPSCLKMMNSTSSERVNAFQYYLQVNILSEKRVVIMHVLQ
ncbi:protein unc-45 homolog B-like [Temnothorax longispinosus]|uniref:protein unc-45 homolog B-like n=1 Tax=Temnothorax longispinosus TaxID=300112 RepID=UPI003A98D242